MLIWMTIIALAVLKVLLTPRTTVGVIQGILLLGTTCLGTQTNSNNVGFILNHMVTRVTIRLSSVKSIKQELMD